MGFEAKLNEVNLRERLDVELGGIPDESIPAAIERICSITGVVQVEFPLKNDSSHAQLTYEKNQTDPYTIYQNIQSIGYKVLPKLENISRACLRVQGMHCNSCVMNITGTVEDLPGIHHVKVSFDDQSANILFDASIIQLPIIIKEIENLDFQVAMAPNEDQEKSKGTVHRRTRMNEQVRSVFRPIEDLNSSNTPREYDLPCCSINSSCQISI
jgi:copper chaperone CopZ